MERDASLYDDLDAEDDDLVRVSKLLSFLLRHRPDTLGLTLEPGGWVALELLLERVNKRRKLPFSLQREHVESVVRQSGRFELRQGKIRARTGHSVRLERVSLVEPDAPAPEFLYLAYPAPLLAGLPEGGQLLPLNGSEALRLLPREPAAEDGHEVLIVEGLRAQKQGVELRIEGELWVAPSLPARYLLSLRPGFQRQVSAGGVLVREQEGELQFALIRTQPRPAPGSEEPEAEPEPEPEADPEGPEFEDPRQTPDRRAAPDRRQRQQPPPGGVDRRTGGTRRHRRRRSGRWGQDGRLELPKGKLEPGETPPQAAVREVREELGIQEELEVLVELANNQYLFRTPEGGLVFKTVYYYLLRCSAFAPAFDPARAEGIVAVEWWPAERAIAQVAFPNLRPILERAREHLTGGWNRE